MRSTRSVLVIIFAAAVLVSGHRAARADDACRCVAAAGEVAVSIAADVARADALYAHGDYAGALSAYARAYADGKAPVLLYAQAMAQWQLGAGAEARGLLEAYLAAGGSLSYRAQAEASLRELEDRGIVAGTVGGVAGGVRSGVGGLLGAGAGAGAAVGGAAVGGVGSLSATARAPRKKVARGAAIVLGVIAVAAVGTVAIHSIAAGVSDDISLDAKFDLGLGLTGVAVGATAFYVGGLTVATGAVGAACLSAAPPRKMIAPVAMRGGGGVAAAMTF